MAPNAAVPGAARPGSLRSKVLPPRRAAAYAPGVTDLGRLTWPEARELLDERTVALIPVGATEPHGPHLSLDADVTIARAQATRAAELLEARDLKVVVLPALPFGVTRYTEGFAGWITLRPGTLWALCEDLFASLEDQGVRRIVICNAHLEPEHVKVLRNVVVDRPAVSAHRAQVILADPTRRRWATTLGPEFASGECHAGCYESSIVMAADPDGVREERRQGLPAVEIGLIEKMKAGLTTFRAMGADQAYCGDPAAASAGEGRDRIEGLARIVVTSAQEAWPELFR